MATQQQITTQAVITLNSNNFTIKLLKNGIKNDEIDNINKKLALFTDLYHEGEDRLQYMNDEKYEEMRGLIKEEYEVIMRDMEEKLEKRINFYKNGNEDIERDIMLKVERKSEEIKMIQENNKSIFDNYKSVNEEIMNSLKSDIKEKEIYYKNELKMKDDYFTSQLCNMNELKNGISDLTNKITYRSSADKGKMGEEMMYDVLDSFYKYNPNVSYEYRSGFKREGDININYYGLKGCIDAKNYQQADSIRTKEITKFKRDVAGLDFEFGIICSIYDVKFVGKNNFEIEFVDDKPIIYIVNMIDNKDILAIALYVIKQIKSMNSGSDINMYRQQIVDQVGAINELRKITKVMKKSLQDQEVILTRSCNNLSKLAGINDKNVKFRCDICSKDFNSEKKFNNHMESKTHRKQKNKIIIESI